MNPEGIDVSEARGTTGPLLAAVVRAGEECREIYGPAVDAAAQSALLDVTRMGLRLHGELQQSAIAWSAPVRAAGADAFDVEKGEIVQEAYRRWYLPSTKLLERLDRVAAATSELAEARNELRYHWERAAYAARMNVRAVAAAAREVAQYRSPCAATGAKSGIRD